jgi:hypothetical protein
MLSPKGLMLRLLGRGVALLGNLLEWFIKFVLKTIPGYSPGGGSNPSISVII